MKNNRALATPVWLVACAALVILTGCASNTPAPVVERAASVPSEPVKDTYVVKQGDTIRSIARDHNMDYRELIALNNIDSPNRITPGKVIKIKPPAPANTSEVSTVPVVSDVVVARPITGEAGVETNTVGANTATLKREPKAGKEAYSDQALAQAQNAGKPAEPVVAAENTETKTEAKTEPKAADTVLTGDDLAWVWPARGKTVGAFNDDGNKGINIVGKAGDPVVAAADGRVSYVGTSLAAYGLLVVIKHNDTYMSVYAHNQSVLVKEKQTVSKGQKIAEMGNTGADQVMLHFEIRRQPTRSDTPKPVDPLKYLPQL